MGEHSFEIKAVAGMILLFLAGCALLPALLRMAADQRSDAIGDGHVTTVIFVDESGQRDHYPVVPDQS